MSDEEDFAKQAKAMRRSNDDGPPQETDRAGRKTLLSLSQALAKFTPPDYLIDGVLQRGFVYSVTGFTGHGKTSTLLEMAMQVMTGGHFGAAQIMNPGSVAFFAGENPENVIRQLKAKVLACGLDVEAFEDRFHLYEGADDLAPRKNYLINQLEQIDDLRLVIFDTAQAYFSANPQNDSDNDNTKMQRFATIFRPFAEMPDRPSVLIPTHPSEKQAKKDNLVPRGGSAFLNEIDGNFTIWKTEDNDIEFHLQGKLRGPWFEPLQFTLEDRTFPEIIDTHGRQIPIGVVRVQVQQERSDRAKERQRALVRQLQAIKDGAASVRKFAEALGCSTGKANSLITDLRKRGYVTGKSWKLSELGEAELEMNT